MSLWHWYKKSGNWSEFKDNNNLAKEDLLVEYCINNVHYILECPKGVDVRGVKVIYKADNTGPSLGTLSINSVLNSNLSLTTGGTTYWNHNKSGSGKNEKLRFDTTNWSESFTYKWFDGQSPIISSTWVKLYLKREVLD